MKRSGWVLIAAAAVVAIVGYLWLRPGREQVAIDLIDTFSAARKQPREESFAAADATLSGQTKRSIQPKEPSRISWNITVPEKAWLKVDLGVLEQGWTMEGDGVHFEVGVSTGGHYEAMFSLVVNPFGNPADRGWHEIPLDLSEYAGEQVTLIFNTRSSLQGDNRNGDFPVWGAPRVVIQ